MYKVQKSYSKFEVLCGKRYCTVTTARFIERKSVHGEARPILRAVALRIGRASPWIGFSRNEPDALSTSPDVIQGTGVVLDVCGYKPIPVSVPLIRSDLDEQS